MPLLKRVIETIYYVTAHLITNPKHNTYEGGKKIPATDLERVPSSAITLLATTTGAPTAETLDTSGAPQLATWGVV
ncbi:MAG: hypothetical protein GAK29_04701 [Acinetobacter bereziniae]|uniref:Uncharacterized protein n=1 Tax=Acinetobacter bereziniae TaxID=106648 RepID=A0A833UMK6_ACIBZ|nr:MAG: hypothetical protein GAK29_04701 [Acinetobacter bereziniae]